MSADSASFTLTHHFLIAMPSLEDETFSRTVVYMCEHSAHGAMGLIINKPSELSMQHLFDKVDLPLRRDDLVASLVLYGGPVQTDRGFVLHDPIHIDDAEQEGHAVFASTLTVPGGLEMTTSRDVLEALSSGAGPRRVLVTLGYASWGKGQLESELAENSWLTVSADLGVVFDTPLAERYEKALDLLGLKSWMLSPEAGHA
jgi:putative transcriptional regulator